MTPRPSRRLDAAGEGPERGPELRSGGPAPAGTAGQWLSPAGAYCEEIEIGMSLTGRAHLAEGPLLKRIGDLRWGHIRARTGVPTRELVDADGHRIYPAFFYVHVAFPPDRPMSAYRESDRVVLADTLRRYGGGVLDGATYLLPRGSDHPGPDALDGPADARAAGIPAVRLSNVFVASVDGARRLKKSPPANPGFSEIAKLDGEPDAYATLRSAQEDGVIERPGDHHVPLCDEPRRVEYDLVPDRDVNGAGLLYFAHYPVILDICERRALRRSDPGLRTELLDRRTVIERTSVYLRNASAEDAVEVTVAPWIRLPPSASPAGTGDRPVRLHVNYRMRRLSDGELMLVSTARKTLHGRTFSDLEAAERLRPRRRAGTGPQP